MKHYSTSCDKRKLQVCQKEGLAIFQLRGLCEDSEIDRFYLMKENTELMGYIKTKMVWSANESRWQIFDITQEKLLAYSEHYIRFPIGTHQWKIIEENCVEGNDSWRALLLHAAVYEPGHFCCANGHCFDSEFVCDLASDCDDNSDETNCPSNLLLKPEFYETFLAPSYVTKIGDMSRITRAKVHVSFAVHRILAIDEVDSLFSLIFEQTLEWTDYRLMFKFLKNDSSKNTVFDGEMKDMFYYEDIWKPEHQFGILKQKWIWSDYRGTITVRRTGEPSTASTDDLETLVLYSGNESIIQWKTMVQNQNSFICSFSGISLYPFDTETCPIRFEYIGPKGQFVELIPGELNLAPSSFGDYKILKGKSIYKIGDRVVAFDIILGRNFQSIFLVTYLPTILMNIINQSTNYIKAPGRYEFIVTVNVTCMMVLASIYLAVSSSLPKTEMIKPVEVWLLVNLAYPFLVIIVNIILQVMLHNANS